MATIQGAWQGSFPIPPLISHLFLFLSGGRGLKSQDREKLLIKIITRKLIEEKIVSFYLQNIARDGEFSTIVDLLDSEDRDLVYAAVGILVNLMSDPLQRPLFK